MDIILVWVYFIISIYITVLVHELGHMISALWCKVKVEAFAIGFGKPFWHKKIGKIDFRLCPILLGGYTKLAGEHNKSKNGFMSKRYSSKFFIAISGALMNFLIAGICYLINFKSISLGVTVDIEIIKAMFTKDYTSVINLLIFLQPNLFLLQLSMLNLFCGIFNLLPIPALDGGLIWLVFLKKRIKNFERFMKRIGKIGFVFLTILQIWLVIYIVWR